MLLFNYYFSGLFSTSNRAKNVKESRRQMKIIAAIEKVCLYFGINQMLVILDKSIDDYVHTQSYFRCNLKFTLQISPKNCGIFLNDG